MKVFKIAVMPGDGIGNEVTPPALELVKESARQHGIELNCVEVPAGAQHFLDTGDGFPEDHFEEAANADAIYLGAMGLPDIRHPDGTEVGPQHDLRKRLNLYAGIRPCRTMPKLPLPLADPRSKTLDFVIVRESTEGIFAEPRGHALDTQDAAHNLIRITRKTTTRMLDFSFRLAQRRQARGLPGHVTCSDKANVLSSQAFMRNIFYEVAKRYPGIQADHQYVDATALDLVRCPWRFDVVPTENQYGDILSDISAALMGGMGMTSSGEIGDNHGVFQPCHGSAPDIMGEGKANPTGMILSGAIMLDYLGDKFHCPEAIQAAQALETAVIAAYDTGTLLPYELGGNSGTAPISELIGKMLSQ
ncbi:isocitrate/isopropylmalate family dehydrogenase [Aestuariirhabdus sp. Z084]|uniref:isocitrate/isopropylmalate dehydrogenase family protein n=1 Tax=Aestuariirhabdus haliotis TaxID=2918751 RepID=UPI00201B3FE6|nr:isocitrate/isopropylmalate family dehydrogenase [Aestuariirhabdus haliotis]MCL6416505.1 isocitrate/isopropylmalate family dehydrogenase [Aestuariirhabdus haliotis]MCL6420495.1 isocitrate/isopropylmalate family dehydrogenase [Aestuariirhabdus haliotis]